MNWFKKQLNKLFLHDTEDDEIYYDNIDEITEEPKENKIETNQRKKSTSFRFPLIADHEIETPQTTSPNFVQKEQQSIGATPISQRLDQLQQPIATSKVYDVEVSGIRDLLEKRQRKSSSSNVSVQPSTIRRVEKERVTAPISRVDTKTTTISKKEIKSEIESVPVAKRRFVPTNVPSPVHGFKKPSTIDELLTKKNDASQSKEKLDITDKKIDSEIEKDEPIPLVMNEASMEVAVTTVAESEVSVESIPPKETEERREEQRSVEGIVQEQVQSQSFQTEDQDKGIEQVTPIEVEKDHLKESEELPVLATNETDEERDIQKNSPIDIEEELEEKPVHLTEELYDHVEEVPILGEELALNNGEKIEKPNIEVQPVTDADIEKVETSSAVDELPTSDKTTVNENDAVETKEEVEQKKGSTLPFNVLMLKSDKEKLARKIAQKQLLQHNDDIKENFRPKTNSPQTQERPKEVEQLLKVIGENDDATNDVDQREESPRVEHLQEEDLQIVEIEKDHNDEIQTEELTEPSTKIYVKPSFEFLSPPEEKNEDREWMESQGDILVDALSHFQVTAQVESIMQGPAVTQFEITVGHGTKVSKIRNLSDDLKLALAARDIRIQAPIPGKRSIGIEIPNRISRAVRLSEVTNSEVFIESESPLEAALGLDLTGKPVTIDLRKMPHGLIAGATGSGKSVCINSILVSLLYKATPHELKLMLIDPKMVELAPFNHIPHLVSPVITDVKAATAALKWAVEEMERRYQLFAHAGVRDLSRFNKLAEENGDYGHKLPYILIVIDELADLMMMSPADVEEAICRIAQKARACGIHLIVATQRPSVDVITGLIKSNIPTRIAFAVSSQVDSRTILDNQGAERLLGRGDMLYLGNGMSSPIRLQGTFVTDDEIEEIIDHVRSQGEPDYMFEQEELLKKTEMIEEQDELFEEVCRFVYEQGTASTSSIQRKYHIGYNRAARLMDLLEGQGFISEQRGSKPREVYITDSDLSNLFD